MPAGLKDQIGLAFDIRHAAVEPGFSWPAIYDVVKPHIGALSVKDLQWDGRKAKNVPLGTGRIDPKFFNMVKADGFNGPLSLHVEYLDKEGTQATPKLNNSTRDALNIAMNAAYEFFEECEISADARVLANDDFFNVILQPVVELSSRDEVPARSTRRGPRRRELDGPGVLNGL